MKRFLTLSIIVLLATAAWSAKTAQAIWTEGNTTLTFTYGNLATVGGTYNGQTVTAVWSGTDVTATAHAERPILCNPRLKSLFPLIEKQKPSIESSFSLRGCPGGHRNCPPGHFAFL